MSILRRLFKKTKGAPVDAGSPPVETSGEAAVESVPLFGHLVYFDPNTVIGQSLQSNGQFESGEIDICKRFISERSIVLDVGANIGVHTVAFASFARDGMVVAFEPSPDVFPFLMQNTRSLSNALPMNMGLSQSSGIMPFYVASDNAFSSLKDTKRKRITEKVNVFVASGDEIVSLIGLERVDFIKVDVEGLEQLAIEGLAGTINRFKPVIFCEIYGGEASNPDPDGTVRHVIGMGYDAFVVEHGDLVPYKSHRDHLYNYFFVPKK